MRADKHGGSNFPGIQKRWRKKNKAPHRFFAPKAPIQNAAPFVGGRLFPASLGSSRRYPANSSVTHFPLRAWSRPWAAKIGRKQPPFLFADGNAEVGFHSTCSTYRRAQRLLPLGTSPPSGREGSWTTDLTSSTPFSRPWYRQAFGNVVKTSRSPTVAGRCLVRFGAL